MIDVAYFMNGIHDGAICLWKLFRKASLEIKKNLNRRLEWMASNIHACRACSFAGIDCFTIAMFLLSITIIVSSLATFSMTSLQNPFSFLKHASSSI